MKALIAFWGVWGILLINGLPGTCEIVLKGAGATFPSPLYEEWVQLYGSGHAGRITYEKLGSGAGIRLFLANKVDFGATDAFLCDTEKGPNRGEILHIPTCLGAVALITHLPGAPNLRLTGRTVADIFLGRISHWSAPSIQHLNPRLPLPDTEITVVHRSASSGTSFILTDYLCKVSKTWQTTIGRGKHVNWPSGIGVDQNNDVAELVDRIAGSIGYVSLTYAIRHNQPTAWIENRRRRFVQPTIVSVQAAANTVIPADARIMITNTSDPLGYPISGFSYFIVYREQAYGGRTLARAKALRHFLHWVLSDGQRSTKRLHYAPLSANTIEVARSIVDRITFQGKPLGQLP